MIYWLAFDIFVEDKLVSHFYSIEKCAMVRLLSSVFHFRAESISVTLSLGLKRFKTQRAALLWTISTMLIFLALYGSHTVEQYSRVGRTEALYAVSLVFGGQFLRFRLRKPKVLLALFDMLSTRSFRRRSSDRWTPRYLTECRDSRV